MSTETNCIYGIGIDLEKADISKITDFVYAHRVEIIPEEESRKELETLYEDYMSSARDADKGTALFDYVFEDECDEQVSIYCNIAAYLTKKTNIPFYYYCANEDGGKGILFPELYPWHYSKYDMPKLSGEDDVIEIIADYAKELGFEKDELGEIKIEYWG